MHKTTLHYIAIERVKESPIVREEVCSVRDRGSAVWVWNKNTIGRLAVTETVSEKSDAMMNMKP